MVNNQGIAGQTRDNREATRVGHGMSNQGTANRDTANRGTVNRGTASNQDTANRHNQTSPSRSRASQRHSQAVRRGFRADGAVSEGAMSNVKTFSRVVARPSSSPNGRVVLTPVVRRNRRDKGSSQVDFLVVSVVVRAAQGRPT